MLLPRSEISGVRLEGRTFVANEEVGTQYIFAGVKVTLLGVGAKYTRE